MPDTDIDYDDYCDADELEDELTPEEIEEIKEAYSDIAHALNYIAAMNAGGAAVLGFLSAGVGAAVCGVGAAGAWALGTLAADLADDPPNPDYKKKVKVKSKRFRLPKGTTKEFKSMVKATRITLKAVPVVKALLDALEKYQGASKARDKKYMKTLARDVRRLLKRSTKNIEDLKEASLISFSNLDGTKNNVKIDRSVWKKYQAKVKKSGLPNDLKDALKKAGFDQGQIKGFKTFTTKVYRSRFKPAKLSFHMRLAYYKLVPITEKMTSAGKPSKKKGKWVLYDSAGKTMLQGTWEQKGGVSVFRQTMTKKKKR